MWHSRLDHHTIRITTISGKVGTAVCRKPFQGAQFCVKSSGEGSKLERAQLAGGGDVDLQGSEKEGEYSGTAFPCQRGRQRAASTGDLQQLHLHREKSVALSAQAAEESIGSSAPLYVPQRQPQKSHPCSSHIPQHYPLRWLSPEPSAL